MDRINILIKYGELTLKKGNARLFKDMLKQNVERALINIDCDVHLSYSRLYISVNSTQVEEAISELKNVYGISSFAVYTSCELDIEVIKQTALKYLMTIAPTTFKVETKRKNKSFDMESTEISRVVGGYINQNSEFIVDVNNPNTYLKIEIRNSEALIYYNEYAGLGGLPVSSNGKVLLMLSCGIDSPVAGFLVNKRGMRFDAVHFTSPPYTAVESITKVKDLCDKLVVYNGSFNLYIVNFTKSMEKLLDMRKMSFYMVIMRRLMYRIANVIAKNEGHLAIVSGDAIGQVASQTLESITAVENISDLPIIRPLSIFDKLETIAIAKKIDTFDISIRNFDDCCTVFLPPNPVIKPKVYDCEAIEKHFDLSEMIEEVLSGIEIVKIKRNSNMYQNLL